MELEEEEHSTEQKQQLPEVTLCHQLSNHDPDVLTFQGQSIATHLSKRQQAAGCEPDWTTATRHNRELKTPLQNDKFFNAIMLQNAWLE